MKEKIKVIEKTPGKHIDYKVTSEKIIFGDDDLSVKLANRERDYEVPLDICIDKNGALTMGAGGDAVKYAAQIIIPPREYDWIADGVDDEGNPREVQMEIPFDMSRCTLILWGLEV